MNKPSIALSLAPNVAAVVGSISLTVQKGRHCRLLQYLSGDFQVNKCLLSNWPPPNEVSLW